MIASDGKEHPAESSELVITRVFARRASSCSRPGQSPTISPAGSVHTRPPPSCSRSMHAQTASFTSVIGSPKGKRSGSRAAAMAGRMIATQLLEPVAVVGFAAGRCVKGKAGSHEQSLPFEQSGGRVC